MCFDDTDSLLLMMAGLSRKPLFCKSRICSCTWLSAAHVSFVPPSSCGLTSALYEWQVLIVLAKQKARRQLEVGQVQNGPGSIAGDSGAAKPPPPPRCPLSQETAALLSLTF